VLVWGNSCLDAKARLHSTKPQGLPTHASYLRSRQFADLVSRSRLTHEASNDQAWTRTCNQTITSGKKKAGFVDLFYFVIASSPSGHFCCETGAVRYQANHTWVRIPLSPACPPPGLLLDRKNISRCPGCATKSRTSVRRSVRRRGGFTQPMVPTTQDGTADLASEPWTLPPLGSMVGSHLAEAFRASGLEFPRAALITLSPEARFRRLCCMTYKSGHQ